MPSNMLPTLRPVCSVRVDVLRLPEQGSSFLFKGLSARHSTAS
jgi:hypothetical protein